MGERLQSQKSYVCSFFDCKAKFSKSWKLEAHLCKHTGLVSGSNQLGAKQNNEKSGHITTADCLSFLTTVPPPLTSETILLWELWQELLHPLSALQTWAQSQWGKAAQVSRPGSCIFYLFILFICENSSMSSLFFCLNCYLLWAPGVWLTGALKPSSQQRAWRPTWLECTSARRSNIKYNNPVFSCAFLFFSRFCDKQSSRHLCFLSVWSSGLWKVFQQEEPAESPSVWAPADSAISVSF